MWRYSVLSFPKGMNYPFFKKKKAGFRQFDGTSESQTMKEHTCSVHYK